MYLQPSLNGSKRKDCITITGITTTIRRMVGRTMMRMMKVKRGILRLRGKDPYLPEGGVDIMEPRAVFS